MATPAFVQGKGQSGPSGATVTITFDAALTSGNFLIIVYGQGSQAATMTPSTSPALTFNTVTGSPFDRTGGTGRLYVAYAQIDQTGITQVVCTRSTGTATMVLLGMEFSGMATSSEVDQISAKAEFTAATSHDISAITTTQADEVLIGAVQSTSGANFSAGTNMTLGVSPNPGSLGAVYRILSGTGSYTTPMTSAVGEDTVMVGVSFKAAVAAGGRTTKNTRGTQLGTALGVRQLFGGGFA